MCDPEKLSSEAAYCEIQVTRGFPKMVFCCCWRLISYGPNFADQTAARQAALIVSLEERNPDLPVQAPTKYELVINVKTAKATRSHNSREVVRHRRRGNRTIRGHCRGES
jgi:hypothetical protein